MRIISAENLRVPGPGDSAQGKSEPKARLKSVVDGNHVNIREPVRSDEGRVSYLIIGFQMR